MLLLGKLDIFQKLRLSYQFHHQSQIESYQYHILIVTFCSFLVPSFYIVLLSQAHMPLGSPPSEGHLSS